MTRLAAFIAYLLLPALVLAFDVGTTAPKREFIGKAILPMAGGAGGLTRYVPLDGTDVCESSADCETVIGRVTRLRKIRMAVDVAPDTGKQITGTVQTGTCGSLGNSDIIGVIQDLETTNEDSGAVTIAAGDCGVVKYVYSAGAVKSTPRHWIEVQ